VTYIPAPVVEVALTVLWETAWKIKSCSWTAWNNTYYTTSLLSIPMGKASRVEVNGEVYTEQASAAACNDVEKSWFWDEAVLYVHCPAGASPAAATNYPLFYFWEYYASHSPLVLNGIWHLPYLASAAVPSITSSTGPFHTGGTQQSFGNIKFLNNDAYWDARLSLLVYEAKLMKALVGNISTDPKGVITADPADFATVWMGFSGNIHWDDEFVEVETEDLRRVLY